VSKAFAGVLSSWLINPRGWKRISKLSRVNRAAVRDLLITQEFVTLRAQPTPIWVDWPSPVATTETKITGDG